MKILVFKPGTWNGTKYSKEFAHALVEQYNKGKDEAPVVIGHNNYSLAKRDADEFAHAWVDTLESNGAGLVYAYTKDETYELMFWVEDKKLKHASLEFSYELNENKEPVNPQTILKKLNLMN